MVSVTTGSARDSAAVSAAPSSSESLTAAGAASPRRSGESRGGEEWRFRGAADPLKKKKNKGWGSVVEASAPEGSIEFTLRLPGHHDDPNGLAPIASAGAVGRALHVPAGALEALPPMP